MQILLYKSGHKLYSPHYHTYVANVGIPKEGSSTPYYNGEHCQCYRTWILMGETDRVTVP